MNESTVLVAVAVISFLWRKQGYIVFFLMCRQLFQHKIKWFMLSVYLDKHRRVFLIYSIDLFLDYDCTFGFHF